MEFQQDTPLGDYIIEAYQDDHVTINQTDYYNSLLITPNQLIPNWEPTSVDTIKDHHWEPVIATQPNILILGTGDQSSIVHPEKLQRLYQARIGVEVMPTGAACRTYMALLAEGRDAMAAIIIA